MLHQRRDEARLTAGAVRVRMEADDAKSRVSTAEPVRRRPTWHLSVGDHQNGRDATAHQFKPCREPVPAAGEHDDDISVPRMVVGREHEQGGRRGGEQDDGRDGESVSQWAIARSTASCSSGESATGARPRSTSFM